MTVGNHTLPTDLMDSCTQGTMYCLADWAGTVTQGFFWIFALLGFAFVIYMATLRFGGQRALGFASFTGLIGAVWLAILGFITWWVASAFIIIGIIGLATMMVQES